MAQHCSSGKGEPPSHRLRDQGGDHAECVTTAHTRRPHAGSHESAATDTDYDVIICGLGPVGQLLALLLGDRGVSTLAVDREDEPYMLPRAAAVDDELLRILQWVRLDRIVLTGAGEVQHGASLVTAAGRRVEVFRARSSGVGQPPLVSINQPALTRPSARPHADRDAAPVRADGQAVLRPRDRGRSACATPSCTGSTVTVTDPGADGEWLRRHGLRWALLRPDRFVFACGGPEAVRAGVRAWRKIAPPVSAVQA